ncbi:Dynamin-2, partial [Conglomerata obtusa]
MTTENNELLLIQQIQECLYKLEHKIELPKIVVIGSQSSGKSSVLEKILLQDILPKGTNIVTRCPIKIQMRKSPDNIESIIIDENKFTNCKQAKTFILKEMKKICGDGNNISSNEINVILYAKDCIEITLIDLPGLTKIPLKGQPTDLEAQLEELTLNYISGENVIILPIIPANVDITTVEALKLCRKVDPQGKRTLGVVSKIDLMDSETDCLDILNNKIFPLALGYIGVINRGQGDLNNKSDLKYIIQKEKNYFSTSFVYKKIYPKIGTEYLINKLQLHFHALVVAELPLIKKKFIAKSKKVHEEYKNLNHITIDSFKISFVKFIKNTIKQKISHNDLFNYNPEKNIFNEFHELFNIENQKYFFSNEVLDEIKNCNNIFISENLFKKIINERYISLKQEILQKQCKCFELIKIHITSIKSDTLTNILGIIKNQIFKLLNIQLEKLKADIDKYTRIQMGYYNVNYPDFCKSEIIKNIIIKHSTRIDGMKTENNSLFNFLSSNTEKIKSKKFTNYEFDVDLLYNLSNSYFLCMQKNYIDYSIKSAHYHLFEYLKGNDFLNDMSEINIQNSNEFTEQERIIEKRKKLLEKEIIEIDLVIKNLSTYQS